MPNKSCNHESSSIGSHLYGHRPVGSRDVELVNITAGRGKADIPGETNTCLQAAVDYVSNLGGGIVHILPGQYLMNDSLHLRPRVIVHGTGKDTILSKAEMTASRLSTDLGNGHYDVSLMEPNKFKVGMGIHIKDDCSRGFSTTCATLIYRQEDQFGINRALNCDYKRKDNAIVRSLYPIISGYNADDATVENLMIDGRAEKNEYLTGCRGGGIFLMQSHRVTLRNLVVAHYNGDGISFQQCEDLMIEDCRAKSNCGVGFHPGSGSVRPILRRVVSSKNLSDGLFYCFRVSFGTIEDSKFIDNAGYGISIGTRDTDHTIQRCMIEGNGGSGIYFRPGDQVKAGNRTTISNCTIEENCIKNGRAEIHLDAALKGIRLISNSIQSGNHSPKDWVGILVEKEVVNVDISNNKISGHAKQQIRDLRCQ